VLEKDEADILS